MASESFCRRNYNNSAKPCDLILDLLRIPHQDAIKQRKILPWGVILITHHVLTWLSVRRFFSVSLLLCLTAPPKTAPLNCTWRVKHWVEREGKADISSRLSAFPWKPCGNPFLLFPTLSASFLWPSGAGGLWRPSDDTPEQPGCGAGPGAGRLHWGRLGRGVHTQGMSDFEALSARGRVNRFLKMQMGLWMACLFLVRGEMP